MSQLPLPHRLAWQLADFLSAELPVATRNVIYTQLGCQHYRRAAEEALRSAARERISIPHTLSVQVSEWLQSYGDHDDQQHIAGLLTVNTASSARFEQ